MLATNEVVHFIASVLCRDSLLGDNRTRHHETGGGL